MSSSDKIVTHLETKAVMQTRVKFAVLGRRRSRLKVISHGDNPRPTASGHHSRAGQLTITFGLVRRTWRSLRIPSLSLSTRKLLFIWKVFSFYTHYTFSIPPYQSLSTGSGSILGAEASRTSLGISIGIRIGIVVIRSPYVRVMLYRWDFGLGNRTRDKLPVFWSPYQGADFFLLDLQF